MSTQILNSKAERSPAPALVFSYDPSSSETHGVRPETATEKSKRLLDIILSTSLLLLIFPVLLVIAIAVKLETAGPILFIQPRVGKRNTVFQIYKFRSMRTSCADLMCARQTEPDDVRVTKVGNFIRKLSLDELPQLLNVLRGDMSLVGPRPHAVGTSINGIPLADIVPYYARRHCVTPGITGWAQVNGSRGPLMSKEEALLRYDYDLTYIRNQSVTLDLYILLRTALQIFRDPRAF